ncbi:MAG: 1-acyl-sn-glycerol-3-phosphate acyltransferase, partial [Aureliella sp.]
FVLVWGKWNRLQARRIPCGQWETQYAWIAAGQYGMFIIFIPVYLFLFLPTRMILIGESKGFLQAIATVQWGLMGMNVRNHARLPQQGPAIVVANHNSHLDTMAVITLFGLNRLNQVCPVAAADYFLKTKWWAWFSLRIPGIIPIHREIRGHATHPLAPISHALDQGQIVLLFPEGTRGQPEKRQPMQAGIAHLAKRHPEIAIVPISMHGLGMALPRGEGLLVPFICDIFIGEPLRWTGDKSDFLKLLCQSFDRLETDAKKTAFIDEQ